MSRPVLRLKNMWEFAGLLCTISAALLTQPAFADDADEKLAAASAQFTASKFSDAATTLEAFLAAYPGHAKAAAAAFTLGRCRSELKQYDRALVAYQRAVKDDSLFAVANLGAGEAALHLRLYDRAAAALAAAVGGTLKPVQAATAWLWLGQCDVQIKRYTQAEEAYLHVVSSFSTSDAMEEALFGLAQTEAKLNHSDEARTRYQQLLKAYPKSTMKYRALSDLGALDIGDKRYDQAKSELEQAISQTPENDPLRSLEEENVIVVLSALNNYSAAAPYLESAVRRAKPGSSEYYQKLMALGSCEFHIKNYQSAVQAYDAAAKSTENATGAEALYWSGNVSIAAGQPAIAADTLEKLVLRYPQSTFAAKAALKRAEALHEAKLADKATAAFRFVVEKYPSSPEAKQAKKALGGMVDTAQDPTQIAAALQGATGAEKIRGLLRIARIQIDSKKYSEVVVTLKELVKLPAPASAEPNYLVGVAEEALSHTQLAAAALGAAVTAGAQISPIPVWVADAQSRLGWLYLDLKQPGLAEKSSSAALTLLSDAQAQQQARLALIQARIELKKWDAALTECTKLVEGQVPAEILANTLYTQAWIYEQKSSPDLALPIWTRLATEFPTSPNAAEALVRMGDARVKINDLAGAVDVFADALRKFPDSTFAAETHYKLGSALYNQDKTAEASKEFGAGADAKGQSEYIPEALYWAGVANEKLGNKSDAVARLTRLITTYPKHARVSAAKVRLAALKATGTP